jgi:hypothetical protein
MPGALDPGGATEPDRSMRRCSWPRNGPKLPLSTVSHWTQCSHVRAPIAPIARQIVAGSRRTLVPSMPPSAATGSLADRAMPAQRTGPRTEAPGWLAVANTGARKASAAPARLARCRSAGPCAELVIRRLQRPRWVGCIGCGQRPERRCIPAPSAAASRPSPATTRTRRRSRQMRARSRPRASRPGSPSWRSTTPARPRGNRAVAGRGSGSRRASVNNQSFGNRRCGPDRAAAARAQVISRVSTAARLHPASAS